MIKNERQFQLTKAKVSEIDEALSGVSAAPSIPKDLDPALLSAYKEALRNQKRELEAALEEYQELSSGKVVNIAITSFSSLPTALIKARIARGLTQKALAERLKVKEQQVQRWESEEFAGTSLQTLRKIIAALGVEVREEIYFSPENVQLPELVDKVADAGLPKDLLKRILPSEIIASFEEARTGLSEVYKSASVLARVFGFPFTDLLNPNSRLQVQSPAGVRFKTPINASALKVNAYARYANYLANVLASSATKLPQANIEGDSHELYRKLSSPSDPISFKKVLNLAWDSGIIVLPLNMPGGFHGAVWNIKGRFVIALKQTTDLESRWLFDLLHELGHIVHGHISDDEALVEETEISLASTVDDEQTVNEWVEDVIFDGESSEIEKACIAAAGGNLRNLKGALPEVARDYNVNLGCLANHMAHRITTNWWGTAKSIQSVGIDPFDLCRSELVTRLNLFKLSEDDRQILLKALQSE